MKEEWDTGWRTMTSNLFKLTWTKTTTSEAVRWWSHVEEELQKSGDSTVCSIHHHPLHCGNRPHRQDYTDYTSKQTITKACVSVTYPSMPCTTTATSGRSFQVEKRDHMFVTMSSASLHDCTGNCFTVIILSVFYQSFPHQEAAFSQRAGISSDFF